MDICGISLCFGAVILGADSANARRLQTGYGAVLHLG